MNSMRRYLILNIGLLLLLGSFVLFGFQVSKAFVSAATSSQQLGQVGQQYGADTVFVQQYGLFLLMFLLGLTMVGLYGIIGVYRPDNPIGIIPRVVMGLILLTNAITALNSFAVASKAIFLSVTAFWVFLVLAALGLANFAFCLVIWNGYRWGVWVLGIGASLMFILKFAGSVPIVPSIFELSAVAVLIYLLRPLWNDLD